MTVEKFSAALHKELGKEIKKYPLVGDALHDSRDMYNLVLEYAKKNNIFIDPDKVIELPSTLEGLTLNVDMTAKEKPFFLTTKKETISTVSGFVYVRVCQMGEAEAFAAARKVWPEYMPREAKGITERKVDDGVEDVFNTYIPPVWTEVEDKTEDRLPNLFLKLVEHLFPLKIEREYFFSWLYHSLYERAFVYLILCGAPGTGKNRLKLVMRALHGHVNTIDGKRSTLVDKFNSQLAECTLAWFDELHYDMDMENNMKEIQNDSISIEKKGVDATRSTQVHASLAISNNMPRDNFLRFDSRKFVPLKISGQRLEKGMTPQEISSLTKKVENEKSKTFDPKFLAQIARWIKKYGKSDKWPNLEYRGPMFYQLAHTSMSRWQKKAASLILDSSPNVLVRVTYDKDKGFLWSSISEHTQKKNGDRSLQFPDFSTVQYFFDVFLDGTGKKSFETKPVEDSIMGDFWVKSLFKAKILTEAQVLSDTPKGGKTDGKKEDNKKRPYLDL